MHRTLFAALMISAVSTTTAWAQTPPAPRVLTLSFDADGRVNLKAQSVTIREIFVEWARQCGCYVVNAQNIPGGPIALPFQFEHATQRQVLESLLRQVSGYTLTPKRAGSTSISNYETIHITPTSVATQTTYSAAPLMTSTPDDEIPPIVPSPLRVDPNAGPPPAPPQQGQQPPAGSPAQQPAAPRVGTGSVFVPIVPIGGSTSSPAPGSNSQPARPATPAAPPPAGR